MNCYLLRDACVAAQEGRSALRAPSHGAVLSSFALQLDREPLEGRDQVKLMPPVFPERPSLEQGLECWGIKERRKDRSCVSSPGISVLMSQIPAVCPLGQAVPPSMNRGLWLLYLGPTGQRDLLQK